ncbi:DUF3551 domain-containing protein [Bradyrhizobium sp. 44]|jgi:Protein of unknown function (DUF3551)|nr:DUF3551 domain-containing protein [Bradyrhizobium sp. 44]MCK1365826.1 DUF3551 domain-containing protein [Bradyrhizobium sp. 62]MCK1396565.1 DUF3551 domain-containing protein [Bradyrhizobium sp. 39]MCK1404411.1 DUF3551 domain-containing protein [Bradyrhizobium sp. 76]MCK1748915.1 DUF3551 domain-containing protein [Bradyrhizobium sp. 135]UPJ32394.1 DUF3551 domain-containing protein [Bradyrhizobium sp. 4]UPJ45436.1 DUF3551 domain-containing protein [Bradyrhizobium sp. 40]
MRMFILATAAILGTLAILPTATPANAAGSWCSKKQGMTHCGYSTEEQCRASRSGRGGSCFRRQASR